MLIVYAEHGFTIGSAFGAAPGGAGGFSFPTANTAATTAPSSTPTTNTNTITAGGAASTAPTAGISTGAVRCQCSSYVAYGLFHAGIRTHAQRRLRESDHRSITCLAVYSLRATMGFHH